MILGLGVREKRSRHRLTVKERTEGSRGDRLAPERGRGDCGECGSGVDCEAGSGAQALTHLIRVHELHPVSGRESSKGFKQK